MEKYRELRGEVKRIWKQREVKIIPIIIGALGAIPSGHLREQLQTLAIDDTVKQSTLQREVILGSARILRMILNA